MKNLKSLLLLAALTTYINSNCAAAKAGDILNFQFGGGSTSAYTNGAAINDNTQIWNRLRSTAVTTVDNLQYADGNLAAGVSLTYYTSSLGNVTTAFPSGNIDANLMKGYMLSSPTKTGYLYFSGLDNGTYQLYVYSQGKKNVASSMQLTATTSLDSYIFSLSNNGTVTELTENTNWMMQTIIVSDGILNINVFDNSVVNGIQLYQTGNAVPEPGSIVLIGIGGIFIFGYMKQQRNNEKAVDS